MDEAPAYSTLNVDRELTTMFEDLCMRRTGAWRWPTRAPDLTPLFFPYIEVHAYILYIRR